MQFFLRVKVDLHQSRRCVNYSSWCCDKNLAWTRDGRFVLAPRLRSFESEFYWIAWSFHFLHSYLALYTGNRNMWDGVLFTLGGQGLEITNRTEEMAQETICFLVPVVGMRTNRAPELTCQLKVATCLWSSTWLAGMGQIWLDYLCAPGS